MAHDEGLAERLRERLQDTDGVEEKRMFGGIAFLVHGNMSVGVNKELLIARVGADTEAIALARPHARVCMFTRRPMKGWVEVPPEGYADDANLDWFVEAGVRFARSLPRK